MADRFFASPLSFSPTLDISYYSNNNRYGFTVKYEDSSRLSLTRGDLNELFLNWDNTLKSASQGSESLAKAHTLTEKNIETVKEFLTDLAVVMSSIDGYDQVHESVLSGYRNDISSARTAVNNAQLKFLDAKQVYLESPRESQLGSTTGFDSVLEQQAKVNVAKAELEALEVELTRTFITSPIKGVVTQQDAKVGEIAVAGASVISVISDQNFEIEEECSIFSSSNIRE